MSAIQRRNDSNTIVPRPFYDLMRWDPLRDMEGAMSRLFAGFPTLPRLFSDDAGGFEPSIDIYELPDEIVIYAAMPGVKSTDVHVETTSDQITIQGERKPIIEDKDVIAHRQGWLTGHGTFNVSYSLPVEVNPQKVKATFHDGILEVRLTKAEHARARSVKVEVQSGS